MTSDPLTPQERARYLWLIAGRQAEVLTEAELAELREKSRGVPFVKTG